MTVNPIEEFDRANAVANAVPAEEREALREAPPVEAVEPTAAAAAARDIGVDDEGDTTPEDEAELSREARERALEAIRDGALAAARSRDNYAATDLRSAALRELLQSFAGYDNAEAQRAYNHYLDMFTAYDMTAEEAANGESAEMNLRSHENAIYRGYDISAAAAVTRKVRENMAAAIDRWFEGEGVFIPEMLHYTSIDGFTFTPLTQSALQALQAYDVRATYERRRIAAYLRRMATLTPYDFAFADPTGLGALTLAERREFLGLMDGILADGGFDYRAADLAYAFDAEGNPDFSLLDREIDAERRRMADYLAAVLAAPDNQYRELIRQYGAGVVSAGMR